MDRIYNPVKGGILKVVDVMGDDSSVVQAARVSYGAGTKKVSQDRGLIRYLMRNYHETPFEQASIKFFVKVPMDTWRQIVRHRTFKINEYSTRYSVAIDECLTTSPGEWRKQSKKNKQGSEEYFSEEDGAYFTEKEKELHKLARDIYNERIDKGVAREQARKDLPLCNFTEAYLKADLRNLLNFIRLRKDDHAQLEIRAYANAMAEIVKEWVPFTWEAFKDYRLNSMNLSGIELNIIKSYISNNPNWGLLLEYIPQRERNEFLEKAKKLGMLEGEVKRIPTSLIDYLQ